MDTFNVAPPGRSALLPHKIETRPKATAEWLARLPFASPVESAQHLVMALYALNRMQLDEDDRGALLALYRPAVARATSGLEILLAESGVPPHPQQRQAGSLLGELQAELCAGHRQLLRSLTTRRFGRSQIRHIAAVTAHLLAALKDVQLAHYLAYKPVPNGLWREMHEVYQLAKTNGMADKSVHDAPPASQVYGQSLLLALADPPHMSRNELDHIRLYLDAFGGLATLSAIPNDANPYGFVIETGSDHGPTHLSTCLETGDLWLDTEALCRHVHETGVRLRTGDTPRRIGLPADMESDVSLALCKHLLKVWRQGAHRAFKRYPLPGNAVQVVAGVGAIHRLLELVPQAAELTPPDEALPQRDGLSFFAAPGAVNASHWTLSNDSAAGLALTGIPDAPLNLKVGDALAMRLEESAMWSLAVIRWIKMLDARQVELGLERLAPQIQPVWVRPLRGHRKTNPEPGLFVPGLPALQQPDRLMLPSHVYEKGLDAEVWQTPRQYTVTFKHRAESTPSFDLIDFTIFTDSPTP